MVVPVFLSKDREPLDGFVGLIIQVRIPLFIHVKNQHGPNAALGNIVGIFRTDDPV
jgi:hypothetical protein